MTLPPELLEKLRNTGIRIDRSGRLWHEGAEITHAGFRRALLRWLDRGEDGRAILRLDDTRFAYVEVEDSDLLVTSVRHQDDGLIAVLNDETEEALDLGTLEIDDEHAFYCRVRQGRLCARLLSAASQALSPLLVETDSGFAVELGGRRYPIGQRHP